jgi:pteridine reductase
MDLQGKVALVTGGAHRVGKGIALALAQEGAHLVIHYGGSHDAAQQTSAEITAMGVEALVHQADLSDPDAIAAMFEAVRERFGRLDVLVNSAASFVKQPFDAITPTDWDAVLAVNLRAPFLCTQHAARLMRAVQRPADKPAVVVNIGDMIGVHATLGYVQHGVSKAGLLHLTKIAARELAPDIRVNAVIPGPVLPPAGMDPDGEAWRRIATRVPLQRAGSPAHVGQAVLSLVANDYLTGVFIEVDGGEHLIGP